MQLILNIENDSVAKKILLLLEHFKKDGLKIKQGLVNETGANGEAEKDVNDYSDEYLCEHWKEIILSVGNNDEYYKSDQYVEDRGNYLAEKYS